MKASEKQITTIDEYIRSFPLDVQVILEKMRKAVREAAPEASEAISYRIPAFRMNGKTLVYFAAFKHHIGFYPVSSGIEAFKKELFSYKQGKGSVRFPLDKPIPYELVKKIVRFRIAKEAKKSERSS